jgi:hypothetical protein
LFNNQLLSLGDDLEKKYAATSKNGVEGKPGRMIPQIAKLKLYSPNVAKMIFLTRTERKE